jgi:hypothetical protein
MFRVIAVLAVSASAAAVVISDDFTSYNSSLWVRTPVAR